MVKTLNLGRAVNAPKMKMSDHFFCCLGVHTYYSIYCHYDDSKQGAPFEGYYDVCICGHARKREGEGPFPDVVHRAMLTPARFYDPDARKLIFPKLRKR